MAKKVKSYDEAEIIKMFGLKRLVGKNGTALLKEWVNTDTTLNSGEQYLFDLITENLNSQIAGWNEEMLKMNLIAQVLILGHLRETEQYKTYYESSIEATVEGYFLKVKADMMIATGILENPETPYFYFQVKSKRNPDTVGKYKKVKDPKGDVAGQLLEAFLIAQEQNKNDKPIYGCTILGREWEFYILDGRSYSVSDPYSCTNKDDLLKIIAILRKFKEILETRLLD
ncbi:MAG: hypothetical protein RLZZ292_733 [Bacteroidota bacterium]|jgi:hypothetical protein